MRVAKWGNSLAVRLPRDVVAGLSLKEGDEIVLRAAPDGAVDVLRDRHRAEISARMRSMQKPLPADYRFDRGEIYDRDPGDA